MKIRSVVAASGVIISLVTLVACSQDAQPAAEEVSTAASPIVQASGVSRIKARLAGNVNMVDLLDEAGSPVGTLELTTEDAGRVHAKIALRGHTLGATWTKNEISFSRDGAARVSVRAGEAPSAAVDETLATASDLLNVATFVAAQIGVYSPVADAKATSSQLRQLDWGTGCTSDRNYRGSSSTWSSSAQAQQACSTQASQNAYQTCINSGSGTQCSGSNSSSSNTVTPGYFTGYTCTSTLTVHYNCNN